MTAKTNNKKSKKSIVKWIFLGILAIFLIMSICDFCMTMIYCNKIPHRFATAEEGRELMRSNTEYYNNCTQNDVDFKLRKTGGTIDEFIEVSVNGVKDFNFLEKYVINSGIARMSRKLKKNGYELPPIDEIVYINTDMTMEGNASGYTHGTQIYLSTYMMKILSFTNCVPYFRELSEQLLWHEMFHCLTRCNPDFRSQMYSIINFETTGTDYELPPSVKEYFISNPDVEHHDAHAVFNIDGKDIDCFTAFVTTEKYETAQSDFFSVGTTALVPTDGTDTFYTPEQASNFDDVFGRNTGYVIDPEECMADNFQLAMQYGIDEQNTRRYPNPEIIRGVINIVKR
ncbi:MAG: hypothetical protein K6B74_05340 [Ruminococcus sp.]|nr:hypothetical protein [Ruminococcus sp.]